MGITSNVSVAPRARQKRGSLRALKGSALAVAVFCAAGAGYEEIAGVSDAQRYPLPGQLVDVGGHRLHISCMGEGSPTIILDAGLGGSSRDWVLVQTPLSAHTRVCVYDRAGMGWSDAGPEPRSPARIADELHRLLTKAGIPGPYFFVAHSLAGKSARLFAAAHPRDVAGMVLVDTRSEEIDAATPEADTEAFTAALRRQALLLSIVRKLGLVRVIGSIVALKPTLPPGVAGELALLQTQGKSLRATTEEGLARSVDDAALTGRSLGELPLVVIAAGDSNAGIPGWAEAQQGLATLTARGRLVVAEGSSHLVPVERPEIVIEAVLSVLGKARFGD